VVVVTYCGAKREQFSDLAECVLMASGVTDDVWIFATG